MAILVDDLRAYPDSGLPHPTWCHLVSDADFAELHAFAARLGLRRRWFQGDHYDLPARGRARAVALGAEEVAVGELLLRMAGPRGERARRRARAPRGDLRLAGAAAPPTLRYAAPALVVVAGAPGRVTALLARAVDPARVAAEGGRVEGTEPATAGARAQAAVVAGLAAHLLLLDDDPATPLPAGPFASRTALDAPACARVRRIGFGWVGRDRVQPPQPA